MKKMNATAVKGFALALVARYYGFKPKNSEITIHEYTDDLSEIHFTVNSVEYLLSCETSIVKGIGFNGFKLDTLNISRLCGVFEGESDNETENDTDE